jgi:hypothetical protein
MNERSEIGTPSPAPAWVYVLRIKRASNSNHFYWMNDLLVCRCVCRSGRMTLVFLIGAFWFERVPREFESLVSLEISFPFFGSSFPFSGFGKFEGGFLHFVSARK